MKKTDYMNTDTEGLIFVMRMNYGKIKRVLRFKYLHEMFTFNIRQRSKKERKRWRVHSDGARNLLGF